MAKQTPVVPPTFSRRRAGPLAFWCGKGTAPVSEPAPPVSFPRACRRPLSAVGAVSVRRCGRYSSGVNAVMPLDQTFSGVVGRRTVRQSRSPRARPWMSISAVATLVAKGTLCWSHRLEI